MTREEKLQQFAEQNTKGLHLDRHNLIQMVKQGAEWADSHPRWIPVEERLPEETEVVLGVREGGTDVEMYKFMGFNESTNTFDWEWHPYYRAVVDNVTHWMEIVPPRKEEKK